VDNSYTFKYIRNVSEQEGTILIYKQIGNSIDQSGNIVYGVNGSDFANEMEYLQRVCSKITVRINSPGGSVLDGYAIASSILHSQKPVHTIVDGVAASTAGWCAACGSERSMVDYGSFMMHNSSGAGDKDMQNLIDTSINTILSNRSGKTPEDITNMMKKETWLNASQAKENGLIDNIISSGKKFKTPKNATAEQLASIFNKSINNPNMEKVAKLLNLASDASEKEITSAIDAKDSKIKALETELEALKAENIAKENAAKEAAKTKAEALANKLETEKKITADQKADVIQMAIVNYSFVESTYSKIGTPSNQVSTKVFDIKNVKTGSKTEDRSEWTIRDWEKKDPKGLGEMQNSTPEVYQELYDNFYKNK